MTPALRVALAELGGLGMEELVDARYAKFSAMTAYEQVDAGADG